MGGGTVLTSEEKRTTLDKMISDRNSQVLKLMMRNTHPEDITRAAFYDRKNLNLPYVDGLAGLLGDAAHPQSPMMGQGANMAIVDGYVAARLLVVALKDSKSLGDALLEFDTKQRRKDNNAVIKKARF